MQIPFLVTVIVWGAGIVAVTGASYRIAGIEIEADQETRFAPMTLKLSASTSQTRTVRVGEDGVRRAAIRVVLPEYPKESIRNRKSGVGVAEILYDGDGNVINVASLEAPDDECSRSIIYALRQWKFEPSKVDGVPVNVKGKLTFYFEIDNKGNGKVRSPKQFS